MSDPFESYIERELQLQLTPLVRSAVPPHAGRFAAVALAAGVSMAAGPSLLAALTGKTAATVVVVTLAAGGSGAVAATVATGSPDPAVWTREGLATVASVPAPPISVAAPAIGAPATQGHVRAAAAMPAATAPSTPAQARGNGAQGKDANGNGNGNGKANGHHHSQDDSLQPSRPPHK